MTFDSVNFIFIAVIAHLLWIGPSNAIDMAESDFE